MSANPWVVLSVSAEIPAIQDRGAHSWKERSAIRSEVSFAPTDFPPSHV